jgi:DNA-binding NarL/FixJ family response regulator
VDVHLNGLRKEAVPVFNRSSSFGAEVAPDLVVLVERSALLRGCLTSLADGAPTVGYPTLEHLPSSWAVDTAAAVIYRLDGLNQAADLASVAAFMSRNPKAALVLLVQEDTYEMRSFARRAGARGVVSSHTPLQQAVKEIERLRALPPSPTSAYSVSPTANCIDDPLQTILTPRQIDIITLVERGETNKVIAYRLGLCENTVKAHLRSILFRLKAHTRQEAVHKAAAFRRSVAVS